MLHVDFVAKYNVEKKCFRYQRLKKFTNQEKKENVLYLITSCICISTHKSFILIQ